MRLNGIDKNFTSFLIEYRKITPSVFYGAIIIVCMVEKQKAFMKIIVRASIIFISFLEISHKEASMKSMRYVGACVFFSQF